MGYFFSRGLQMLEKRDLNANLNISEKPTCFVLCLLDKYSDNSKVTLDILCTLLKSFNVSMDNIVIEKSQ